MKEQMKNCVKGLLHYTTALTKYQTKSQTEIAVAKMRKTCLHRLMSIRTPAGDTICGDSETFRT